MRPNRQRGKIAYTAADRSSLLQATSTLHRVKYCNLKSYQNLTKRSLFDVKCLNNFVLPSYAKHSYISKLYVTYVCREY